MRAPIDTLQRFLQQVEDFGGALSGKSHFKPRPNGCGLSGNCSAQGDRLRIQPRTRARLRAGAGGRESSNESGFPPFGISARHICRAPQCTIAHDRSLRR
jgi:hypothetical protein